MPVPKNTILDTKSCAEALLLMHKNGFVSSTVLAVRLMQSKPDLSYLAAYAKANRLLRHALNNGLTQKRRIEKTDCFAVTAKGCDFIATHTKWDRKKLSPTVKTLADNKSGRCYSRHRLLADLVGLLIQQRLNNKIRFRVVSERQCIQKGADSIKLTGKITDGRLEKDRQIVAIEIERSRRKANSAKSILKPMRHFSVSAHGKQVGLWLFVTNKDTHADTLRFIRNEFMGSGFDEIEVSNDEVLLKFCTSDQNPKSIVPNSYAETYGTAYAFVVRIDDSMQKEFYKQLAEADAMLSAAFACLTGKLSAAFEMIKEASLS